MKVPRSQTRGSRKTGPMEAVVVWGVAESRLDAGEDGLAFGFGEPRCGVGRVREIEEEEDAEEYCGEGFHEEEPLPAGEAELALEIEEGAGDGSHEDRDQRIGDVEAGDGPGAHVRGEPLHEVEDDSGEEAGFGHAEQEAGDVELDGRADEEPCPSR